MSLSPPYSERIKLPHQPRIPADFHLPEECWPDSAGNLVCLGCFKTRTALDGMGPDDVLMCYGSGIDIRREG